MMTAVQKYFKPEHSENICHKLLCFCYYYSRCFGAITLRIGRCRTVQRPQHFEATTIATSTPESRIFRPSNYEYKAYEQRFFVWFNMITRCICALWFFYSVLHQWITEDPLYTRMVIGQGACIAVCPIIDAILGFWHRQASVLTINALLKLIRSVKDLHPNYELYQWTHVLLVSLKLLSFSYELCCTLYEMVNTVRSGGSLAFLMTTGLEMYLMIGTWLCLHVTSIFYISIDALYGALNDYMRREFIPRLDKTQRLGPTNLSPTHMKYTSEDLAKFSDLFTRIHKVASKLHYILNVPLGAAILYIYCGTICVVYYLIWQFYELGVIQTKFIIFVLKLLFDIAILSLTGHRVIKASRLIRCMSLENTLLTDNIDWNRQVSS